MSLQPFLTTLSLMMLLALSCAHIGGNPPAQDLTPRYYCGKSLARALALICYDELFSQKKSEAGTMYNAVLTPYFERKDPEIFPWNPLHQTRGLGLPSRGKRYDVGECCDKPCSVEELLSFCG